MHIDTHSPSTRPALPFPQSTMGQTQMLPSLTRRGKGQTENLGGGGCQQEGDLRGLGLGLSGFSLLIAISPAPQGQKLALVRFHHCAEGAQRKVGICGGRRCLGESKEAVASFSELVPPLSLESAGLSPCFLALVPGWEVEEGRFWSQVGATYQLGALVQVT